MRTDFECVISLLFEIITPDINTRRNIYRNNRWWGKVGRGGGPGIHHYRESPPPPPTYYLRGSEDIIKEFQNTPQMKNYLPKADCRWQTVLLSASIVFTDWYLHIYIYYYVLYQPD